MEIRTIIQIIFALLLIAMPVNASEIELTESEFVVVNLSTATQTGDSIMNASGSVIQKDPSGVQYLIDSEYYLIEDQTVFAPEIEVLDPVTAPVQINPSAENLVINSEYSFISKALVNPTDTVLNSFNAPIQNNPTFQVFIVNVEYEATLNMINPSSVPDNGDILSSTTVNAPPVVEAGPDLLAIEGSTVHFNGSFTDSGILDNHTITWDFGDGALNAGTLTPAHIYADNGIYTVILEVTDEQGASALDTLTVTVGNSAPVVDAGSDLSVTEGDTVNFSGNFSDSGAADTHIITWDFGDGSILEGTLIPSHIYADDGTFTVMLSVMDDDGALSSDTLTVTVENSAPVVDAGSDLSVTEGGTVNFSGNFIDSGAADTHIVTWDFGDGSVLEGTLTPSHIYADDGTFTVMLSVMDDDGALSSDTLTVTVENSAPVVDAGSDHIIRLGDSEIGSFTFTDPGADEWIAKIDYGDSSPVELISVESKTLTATHIYSLPGEYLITVQIEDDDGGIGTDDVKIVVSTLKTELLFMGNRTGQHSDRLAVFVRLDDPGNKGPLADRSIKISFANKTTSTTTNSEGTGSALFSLDRPVGKYDITSEFTGDGQYSPAVTVQSISIIPEDIIITYSGDIVIPSTSGYINLRATLNEVDPDFGDLNKLKVDFTIFRSDDFLHTEPVASELSVPVVSSGQGIGTAVAAITNLPQGNYSLVATIAPNGYYREVSSSPAVLTVYEPDTRFITGGGWIWDSNESRGTFSQMVKYDKNSNIQGNFMYSYSDGSYDYDLKSISLTGMAINRNISLFQGWAYLEIHDSVAGTISQSSGDGFQFTVEVVDNDIESRDYIKIIVLDGNGLVYHIAEGGLQEGNIKIHDNENKTGLISKAGNKDKNGGKKVK